ncbi:hypothetical protein OSJ20_23735 [Mycobacterium ulcerans]|uniref:Uncharacterized protein n=2 Tax=Mycobacterium ulcerans group TaxID=2993898 RepID=L7VAD4_MYCL1|nr:hypothetical protein [Mycobacterium ulcerans]AGC63132.1 hypothetical protein MULP_03447 [Mycobacterium liflandii 128FXT]EPQ47211.1 hypothetical protein MMSP_2972 [Mycobacterium sp. 012931]EUA87861.1 hypothetical protein I551_5677 [Mycobacterium ulcerans str. Harvey]MBC9866063.1 hypothetical protein [Mycobacterium pseudoshottsii]RFZ60948.1 hypothetical protein DL240490_03674 [Mycobacterium marinum]GAQ36405.1 hypothetical protein MPS_3131 [Mycobacterium pseudoshottsii JCM 15466]
MAVLDFGVVLLTTAAKTPAVNYLAEPTVASFFSLTAAPCRVLMFAAAPGR